jgi:hypothetical protein
MNITIPKVVIAAQLLIGVWSVAFVNNTKLYNQKKESTIQELIYELYQIRPPPWSKFLAAEWRFIVFPVRYELNLYMLCRRK